MSRIVDRSQALLRERGPLSHGFYTSGQLFLEEYYALAIIGKAGIGTPHMDGNTRLCTATAAAAHEGVLRSRRAARHPMRTSTAATRIFLYGHNMAETQTVLWSRVLDRIAGPDRPKLVCVDPRDTEVARHADVHLAVRPGTNLALMHALVREVLANGWEDAEYIRTHTSASTSSGPRSSRGRPRRRRRSAASAPRTSGRRPGSSAPPARVLSTVLQGFYQSAQATAASCQVNNLHLLRGHAGPARLRNPPDERPAHRPEQPGMRRRRRPAGLPQLGESRPHRRNSPRSGTWTR